jgi:cysteinyl-tRNA synthetase
MQLTGIQYHHLASKKIFDLGKSSKNSKGNVQTVECKITDHRRSCWLLDYWVIIGLLGTFGSKNDHICNLTDVDDKIIIKMIAEKKSLKEITEFFSSAI